MAHRSATPEDLRAASEQRGIRVILRINFAIAISIALLTFVALYELRERILVATGRGLEAQTLLLANQAQTALEVIDFAEEVLANQIENTGVSTPKELAQLLNNRAAHDDLVGRLSGIPQMQVLNVHDADGSLVVSTRYWPTADRNVSNTDYFQAFKSDRSLKRIISPLRLSKSDGMPVLFIERQLSTAKGEFLGTVSGAVNLDYFATLYAKAHFVPGEVISMYADDSTLLVREPLLPDAMGHVYPAASMSAFLPLGGPRQILIQKISIFDGGERLIAARRLASYPFIVKVGNSIPIVLAGWRRLALYSLFGVAMIEAMLFWVTRLTWRQAVARIVVARTMTAQLLAERRRLEVAKDMESLIETMPGVVMRVQIGPNFHIIPSFIAPTVADLTGFTTEQVLAPHWLSSHVPRRSLVEIRRQVRATLAASSGHGEVDIDLLHRDGRLLKAHGLMSVQSPVDGVPVVVMIWTDVTSERARALQLAHTYKLAMLGELATGIAHELSQPLATISLMAENAQRAARTIPDAAHRVVPKLESIIDMVARAAGVLDHMRVFGRTGEMAATSVLLPELLAAALPLAQSRLGNARVELLIDLPADLPAILAKAVPLEQVLLNLISNACDAYTDNPSNNTYPRLIHIGAEADDTQVMIRVSDSAGGIPLQVLPRIFEPFFTTKPVGKGTGLGLSISYGIITELGGSIVASNHNGGATFVITLPRFANV